MMPRPLLVWLGLLMLPALPAMSALAADVARPLFVEAEVDRAAPWVQSQVTYTLRAWQGSDLRELVLAGPQARLAEVRPLGPATVREAERAGRRYRVHEQRFAVLPFASGEVELAGAHLAGKPPGSARPLRIEAPTITLRVRPVPTAADGARWLPAEDVVLTETWLPAGGPATDAAPLLRRIRIEARGVQAAQIPELRPEIPGVSVLALPPRLETRIEGTRVIGVREQDFQLIPLRPGPLAVPALELIWWKVPAGTQEVGAGSTAIVRLPARTLAVGAAQGAAAATSGGSEIWPWAAGGLTLLALALLTLRHQPRRYPFWTLRRACRDRDAAAAHRALLAWAARRWPDAPPASLPEFAARLPAGELVTALITLDRQLYGRAGGNWQAQHLWRAVLRTWSHPCL
jgi:hypothetical protein